jgi:DNA-binding Xre family transcriptional regulator
LHYQILLPTLQNTKTGITLFSIMIKANIKEMAVRKGIKTAYQLQKAMNLQPSQAAKLYRNDLKMIGLDTLDSLCDALDCMPSDLLVYSPGRVKAEKPVKSPVIAQKVASSSDSNSDLLSTNQIAAELGLSRKRVNDYIVSGDLKAVKGKQNHNFVSVAEFKRFKAIRNGSAE